MGAMSLEQFEPFWYFEAPVMLSFTQTPRQHYSIFLYPVVRTSRGFSFLGIPLVLLPHLLSVNTISRPDFDNNQLS